jgi:hypothetical protein
MHNAAGEARVGKLFTMTVNYTTLALIGCSAKRTPSALPNGAKRLVCQFSLSLISERFVCLGGPSTIHKRYLPASGLCRSVAPLRLLFDLVGEIMDLAGKLCETGGLQPSKPASCRERAPQATTGRISTYFSRNRT